MAQLVYADPPFNTGRTQTRRSLAVTGAPDGDRVGFGGRRYTTKLLAESSYKDDFDDYLGFLAPRLEELPVLLALTCRPDEAYAKRGLARVATDSAARRLSPRALSPAGAAAALTGGRR